MTEVPVKPSIQRGPDEAADLAIVEAYFKSLGLTVERFSKEKRKIDKTPDFKVMRDKELVAYCEVKSPRDDWLIEQLDDAEPGETVGGARHDPIFNRLARLIEKAASQFDAVNPEREVPNIVFLVNHDVASHAGDLYETLTGLFPASDGSRHATMKKVSEGAIEGAKLRVDLYVWYNNKTGKIQRHFFTRSLAAHVDTLCALLRINKAQIVDE